MGIGERSAQDVLELLAGRWVLPILVALRPGALRFGDLRDAVNSGVSDRSLSLTLHRLEDAGLVVHVDGEDRRRGLYELHADGRSLLDSLGDVFRWAENHRSGSTRRGLRDLLMRRSSSR